MRTVRLFIAALSVMTLVGACRSGPNSPSRPEPAGSKDPYLILATELRSIRRDNLYDTVRQLRPGWFTRRTQRSGEDNIMVYLDDRQVGLVGALRAFSSQGIESIRYLSPTEAQVRYGQINVGRAAILIESARQP